MIAFDCATALADSLIQAAKTNRSRLTFNVDPGALTASLALTSKSTVPMLIGHGDKLALGDMIHSYHQWGDAIKVNIIHTDGLANFWIED